MEKIPADVIALSRAGKKIDAVKRLRELTGMSLKEAKDVVDSVDASPSSAANWASGNAVDDEARRLVQQGKMMDAIKLLRDKKGLGMQAARAQLAVAESPRRFDFWTVVALLALAVAIGMLII